MDPIAARRRPRVMVVDDQDDQILLVRKAFEHVDTKVDLMACTDGPEALDALAKQRMDLVLLDLNMPDMPGSEVLQRIRQDPRRRSTPVVIFSTSGRPDDVEGCFEHGANAYIQKPGGFQELVDLMQTVVDHWFKRTLLPTSD